MDTNVLALKNLYAALGGDLAMHLLSDLHVLDHIA